MDRLTAGLNPGLNLTPSIKGQRPVIFVAKDDKKGLEVQRTAIYFGALHLQRINLSLIYKYFAALRLSN